MIVVENLTKTFRLSKEQKKEKTAPARGDHVDAVADISFTCRPGRIFSLPGPNGAGKTTALIPILNISLATKEIMAGTISPLLMAEVCLVLFALAAWD